MNVLPKNRRTFKHRLYIDRISLQKSYRRGELNWMKRFLGTCNTVNVVRRELLSQKMGISKVMTTNNLNIDNVVRRTKNSKEVNYVGHMGKWNTDIEQTNVSKRARSKLFVRSYLSPLIWSDRHQGSQFCLDALNLVKHKNGNSQKIRKDIIHFYLHFNLLKIVPFHDS